MTFSSQKEVVCGVILGVWVREKPRGVVTFPPPHSFWGDTDRSFRGRSESLLAEIGNPKAFSLSLSWHCPYPALAMLKYSHGLISYFKKPKTEKQKP